MIVLDASAAVLGLRASGESRSLMASEDLQAPHLIDSEVSAVLRRGALRSADEDAAAGRMLATWMRLGVRRHAVTSLLDQVWVLRRNVTAYDATYVVLSAALNCRLITADARLSHAPGLPCEITLVTT